MRVLFVSTTAGGGSGLSQRQLAAGLRDRGHDVALIADHKGPSWRRRLYKRQVNLSTKLRGTPFRSLLLPMERRIGRQVVVDDSFDPPVWFTDVPENGYLSAGRQFRPDVVVAGSIERVAWRRLRAAARADGVPTVLYLREESALGHLTITDAPPDLLLANAESLAVSAREAGFECDMIPSVIRVEASTVVSTRQKALLVNAVRSHGGDRIWELADACPDIHFVLQESWPLDDGTKDELRSLRDRHANVELRARVDDPSRIYRDARVLLSPHRFDNRPRSIAEAQHNGIPVIAADYAGLAEALGPGGLVLSKDFVVDDWAAALRRMWSDDEHYAELCRRASEHAAREEIDPELVVTRFEAAVTELVS